MKFGYVRVSTQTQNIARQMDEMYKLELMMMLYLLIDNQGKTSIVKIT